MNRQSAILRTSLALATAALICSTVLVITHRLTQPKIALQQAAYLQSQLDAVLPATIYDNDLSSDRIVLNTQELGSEADQFVWRARMNGKPVAAILTVTAPAGYNGPITLLVGVLTNGEIQGVRVISHQETPGLGDAIEVEKSNWIRAFEQHSLTSLNPGEWQVKKDGGVFEHFTGATVTPRAITAAIYRALHYFDNNQDLLFASRH